MIELASKPNYTAKVLEINQMLEQRYARRLRQKDVMPFFGINQTSTMSYWFSGRVVPSNQKSKRIIDRMLDVLNGKIRSPIEFKDIDHDRPIIAQWHRDCEEAHNNFVESLKRPKKTKTTGIKQNQDITARLESIERKIDTLISIWKGEDK